MRKNESTHPDATRPTTYASAHPVLRALPGTMATVRGATASEVHAVAELVETLTPEVTVRSVSRKGRVYVVRALAAGRVRIYRIPADMIPRAAIPRDVQPTAAAPVRVAHAA